MQASVRVQDNLALQEAMALADDRGLDLAVVFCLDAGYPEANKRSFAFLLDGLKDVSAALAGLGLKLTIVAGSPLEAVPLAARRAAVLVTDQGYMPLQRRWRQQISENVSCPVILMEDNISVPVKVASDHEEWTAATLRPKLMRLADLEPLPVALPRNRCRSWEGAEAAWSSAGLKVLEGVPGRQWLERLALDNGVPATSLPGGESAALRRWSDFMQGGLEHYNTDRNDPNLEGSSGLAPYLHFGHISPLTLLRDLKASGRWVPAVSYRRAGEDPASKFLDEVLVRRELSINYVWYNPDFSTLQGLPDWARRTLGHHQADQREYLYSDLDWESARTHDEAWNAAQTQLVNTGIMHGYMRMYWGKKLLEWNSDPAAALELALRLNNRYALDGRDPNSYAGVAWCFGKHDMPWAERSVYGLVRCMTSGGLARKFDLNAYVARFTPPS
jgi:deoxyribodipyrimidine photo-lyase